MSRSVGSKPWRANLRERIVPAVALLAIPALSLARPTLEYAGCLAGDAPSVQPNSVTLSPDGAALCITDEASRALDVYDLAGFHRFRTDESAGLRAPLDGSIDAEGRFVFLETGGAGGAHLARLGFLGDPDPYTATPPSPEWAPIHLLITRDGGYLTVDADAVLVKHDGESGAVLWSLRLIESGFERADLTGRPAEALDGTIYVPLTGTQQIAVVSPEGEPRGTFGTPGTKPGEIAFPVGVAVSGSGEVLVLDRFRHSILIYGEDHGYLGEFGRLGAGPGDLYHPVAIAATADGRVYVAQGFEGRVQQFRLTDTELSRRDSGS